MYDFELEYRQLHNFSLWKSFKSPRSKKKNAESTTNRCIRNVCKCNSYKQNGNVNLLKNEFNF